MNYNVIFIFTLLILGSKNGLFAQDKTFFEGTLTYSIEYIPLKQGVSIENLNKYYGTQLIYTTKNGFTRKSYIDEGGYLLQTRVFDPNTYLNSRIITGNDTIYQYHTYKNDFKTLELINLPDTIIDGKKLEGTKIISISKFNPQSPKLTVWYFFDKKLKVNPKYFSKFYEGEWNKIIAEKKSISTYFVIDNGYLFVAKYKAIKIEQKFIDPKTFDLPKNLFPKNID